MNWRGSVLWGLIAGLALVIGAMAGYYASGPSHIIAWIMAFGTLEAACSYQFWPLTCRIRPLWIGPFVDRFIRSHYFIL
jgi:hypothetical protein